MHPQLSPRLHSVDRYGKEWFLSVGTIETPKPLESLVALWDTTRQKQISKWTKDDQEVADCVNKILSMADKGQESHSQSEPDAERIKQVDEHLEQIAHMENDDVAYRIMFGVARALHVKIHLQELDEEATAFMKSRKQILESDDHVLHTKLVLQSYLDYLEHEYNENGGDEKAAVASFEELVNGSLLRLVSTVHPNETERNTNLMHYTRVLEHYINWKREFMSLQGLPIDAPEYRIRREQLNQLRREMKGEIEAVWQSDQLRTRPITVVAEARRLTDRYRTIFKTFPFLQKFTKQLMKEAYWLFLASVQSRRGNKAWLKRFDELWASTEGSRTDRNYAIKKAFRELGMEKSLPSYPQVLNPVISFATWKSGDRDGNPFVTASFTNQTFVEQKKFILEYYIELVTQLVDIATGSTNHVTVSDDLIQSVKQDAKKFPFLDVVKFNEPYRAKLRYIQEKLTNTLKRTEEVVEQAGETTKPLLSSTLPGPSGYTKISEFIADIRVIYQSLVQNHGKSQARSQIQDLQILASTFGFAISSVDFRQVSTQNAATVYEFLEVIDHPYAVTLKSTKSEQEKRKLLLDLLVSTDLEFDPSYLPRLSRVAKDTLQTILIYADASRTDQNMVGKFIISMCRDVSDILNVLVLLKLGGMLTIEVDDQGTSYIVCSQDVTGLFETIEDLKHAPRIVTELLAIPIIRRYIVEQRNRLLTIMLGYSDSVRDGSALCSDAQVARTCLQLYELQQELSKDLPESQQVEFVFYRGRGDTLPRGFGGNIKRAIASQSHTTRREDHTEQNRYLRRYATVSSALDHLHSVYSAHMSVVVDQKTKKIPAFSSVYQKIFDFVGHLSNDKWLQLVSEEFNGTTYFNILGKYTILPVLHTCQFASRPVCRSGVNYNIDNIRAIPFTMDLAQVREMTSAYYGTGTAFDVTSKILDPENSAHVILSLIELLGDVPFPEPFVELISYKYKDIATKLKAEVLKNALLYLVGGTIDPEIEKQVQIVASFYKDATTAAGEISQVITHLHKSQKSITALLQEMYKSYAPFRYSINNKNSALVYRDKRVVDEYTKNATEEERRVLDDTEAEAQLTKEWILKITNEPQLTKRYIKKNFDSNLDLLVLHKIQSVLLNRYLRQADSHLIHKREHREKLHSLAIYVQMTILAISEALGFGG